METLLLDSGVIEEHTPMPAVIDAVEAAFAAYARGTVEMPPKSYIDLPQYNGDFRSMPAYLDTGEWDGVGVKWVNVHPDNPRNHELPTVMGTMIYSDPATAFPLAVMDGMVLTKQRTGAAAAVATKYLAIEQASSLGIIGAGAQSYTQVAGIASVRPIETVVVVDNNEEKITQFIDAFGDQFDVRGGEITDASACDILSTVTPSREPIVPRSAVGDHTHINAIGADAAGKHELDDELLLDGKLVIDDYDQCTHSGEINVPWSQDRLSDDDIYAELGDIVIGNLAGRTDSDEITIFDSTGLAIQDIAAAHVAYQHAIENDAGVPFSLLDV